SLNEKRARLCERAFNCVQSFSEDWTQINQPTRSRLQCSTLFDYQGENPFRARGRSQRPTSVVPHQRPLLDPRPPGGGSVSLLPGFAASEVSLFWSVLRPESPALAALGRHLICPSEDSLDASAVKYSRSATSPAFLLCLRLVSLDSMSEGLELAREYHRNLPAHVREYLQQVRGSSPDIVNLHLLGW